MLNELTARAYKGDSRVRCLFLHPRWREYQQHLTRPFRQYLESLERDCEYAPSG